MIIKQPKNLTDLLTEIDANQSSFVFLNGGTDIIPSLNRGELNVETIYDLSLLGESLHFIKVIGDSLEIGALVSLSDIAHDPTVIDKIPQLSKAINSIGSKQIRNMGTLIGNLANASPIGDSIPVLLVKDTLINLISHNDERSVSINQFFRGYKEININKNEIIKSVIIPFNLPTGKYDFFKVAIRPEMAVSKVNLAYALELDSIRIASGGVKDIPTRLANIEAHFLDHDLAESRLNDLLIQDISPISDLRSTAIYRTKVLLNLLLKLYRDFQLSSRA